MNQPEPDGRYGPYDSLSDVLTKNRDTDADQRQGPRQLELMVIVRLDGYNLASTFEEIQTAVVTALEGETVHVPVAMPASDQGTTTFTIDTATVLASHDRMQL
jgi:hypothetical protein